MSFRIGYLIPFLFFACWWGYAYSTRDNESAAYLFLFAIISLAVSLLFLAVDKNSAGSGVFQGVIDVLSLRRFWLWRKYGIAGLSCGSYWD